MSSSRSPCPTGISTFITSGSGFQQQATSDKEVAACTPIPLNPNGFNPAADIPFGVTTAHIQRAMQDLLKRKGMMAKVSDRLLVDALKDFEKYLEGKRNDGKYISQTIARLESVFKECGFTNVKDLQTEQAVTAFSSFRSKLKCQTANHYLAVVKTFCNWAKVIGDLPRLKKVRVVDNEKRRPATDKEKDALLKATKDNITVWGLSGESRYYLYLVALHTGFRASELASLKPGDFHLKVPRPFVALAAKSAKNRRDTEQLIHPSLAKVLKPWLATLPANEPVWPGAWWAKAAGLLRRDLKLAKVEPVTDAGKLDFHSLRHTFISNLARAGVHPKLAQTLARHSDISLTMGFYTHVDSDQLALALPAVG